MNLSTTLRDSAAQHPDGIAVRLGTQSVTYAELDRTVDAAATALQQVGVTPGDRVALMMGNRVSFVVGFYAALRIGAVVVPVNTSLTSGEVGHELTDCRATAVVIGGAYLETLQALRGTLPDLAHVFVADSSTALSEDPVITSWKQAIEACDGQQPSDAQPDEDTLAVLAYTSGTSGTPKGAMLTHGQLLANQSQLAGSAMAVNPDDVVFLALPLFHIYGMNVGMGPTVAGGGTLELVERFDPSASLQLIADRGVTVIVGAPPMYVAWLNTPGSEDAQLGTVRLATSGAAPLPVKILRRCAEDLGLDVREGYGLTEAAPVVTTTAGLARPAPGSVGRVLEGVEVRITDAGGPAEEGDPGDIQVRGPNVFSGYWERPAETAAVLNADGWLDTGDIGYLDDGLLYLVDRAKDLIIVSGFNVYPVEVEAALVNHPAVMQAAVVGTPHPYTGEAVKAFVVVQPGAEVTADELINHTATLLARFKRPESVDFVTELPMLPTGKLRRRLLRPSAEVRSADPALGFEGP